MKVILLAAGRGSRMKGLTEDKPKCFMELEGKRLFDWQLAAMREAGLNDIVVARGYKKETIKGNFSVVDNDRWSETNMVGTLLCAKEILRVEECIISYADIVYHPSILKSLMASKAEIVITYDELWLDLWKLRFKNPLSDAETFRLNSDKSIKEIGAKPNSFDEIEGQYMGLLKFTPAGWNKIEGIINKLNAQQQDKLDMTSLLNLIIQNGIKINTVAVNGKWVEADCQNDLEAYSNRLKLIQSSKESWSHDWRNNE